MNKVIDHQITPYLFFYTSNCSQTMVDGCLRLLESVRYVWKFIIKTWSHDWRYVLHLTTNTNPSKGTHSDMKPNISKGRLFIFEVINRLSSVVGNPLREQAPCCCYPALEGGICLYGCPNNHFLHKTFRFTLLLGGTFNHGLYS